MVEDERFHIEGRIFACGDAQFFESVAIPVARIAELLPTEEPSSFVQLERLERSFGTPQALLILKIAGAAIIVGEILRTRIVETVWDESIWPRIRESWRAYNGRAPNGKCYATGMAANFKGRDISVVAAAVGRNSAEVEEQQKFIGSVMKQAELTAEMYAAGSVLLFIIENGEIYGPTLHASLESALNKMSSNKLVKPPVFLRPES
ncbi:MAG: hypothetical protein R3F18_17160 [Lysobacterales bacterium]|nr:hypothetical protein [Xanthomonadales bacterium]